MSDSEWIIETSDERFEQDVIQRSKEIPVVVDFWAEWCAPCRMLGPLLEKLAEDSAGQFLLVKADTEQVPRAATEFRIQSIPAVFGFRDGEVRDYFVGVLPEDQLNTWIERLLPTEAEQRLAAAVGRLAEDPAAAEAGLREAVGLDPNLAQAKIELAALLLNQKRTDESRELVEELQRRGFLEPEAERIRAEVHLQCQARDAGSVEQCRAAVAADPEQPSLKLRLAESLAAGGQYQEALEICLGLVRDHKAQFGEPARKVMVDIFQLLPNDSELTGEYRRKLSAALY